MPISFVEIAQGRAFSRESGDQGLNDTFQRPFKVLLNYPGEVFDAQEFCDVYVGDAHPLNFDLTCHGFDSTFEGDSRLVSIVTFKYKTYPSNAASNSQEEKKDPRQKPPNERKCEWTTETSLIEVPADTWIKTPFGVNDFWTVPVNPLGERYDNVTKMIPITTIKVEQFETQDPIKHLSIVGWINVDPLILGSATFGKHTVMFRGMSMKPHVETFRNQTFRGWIVTYDFCYKRHDVQYLNPDGSGLLIVDDIGWDKLVPLAGFNVINDRLGDADVDEEGLSLEHEDFRVKITVPLNPPYTYAAGSQGIKTRAMVAFPCPNGGWGQRPSASPVPLNTDGTPRNVRDGLTPILEKYQTQPEIDFVAVMNLRLPDPAV